MKTICIILISMLLGTGALNAQKQTSAKAPYHVVFDITSKDSMAHKSVIRLLTEITKSNPDAKLEVVFYGQSLDMVIKDKSLVAAEVQKFAANPNVAFRVCQVAMKNHKFENSQLIAGVQTVPDGVYEIISKQAEGWGYIKVAN